MKRIITIIPSLILLSSLVACQSSLADIKFANNGHYTEEQLKYLASDKYDDTTPYNGNMPISAPQPIVISFKRVNYSKSASVLVKVVPVISNDWFVIPPLVTYSVTGISELKFYNPVLNHKYFVTLSNASDQNYGELTIENKQTVPGPRNIYLEGVENVRDIGGWGKMVNGEYQTFMKQCLLYRSGRFNEDKADEVKVTITSNGLKEVNEHLKIKTEIDLRKTSTNEVGGLKDKSVLGDNVKYVQLPMAYNGNNILTFKGKVSGDDYEYDNPKMIKEFFEILADRNNYPINYHCSIGKDRTGCLSYLIEGLMGFDQETMYRDYMFTNFADAGLCKITDITDRYGKTIAEYANGETLQEKVYNYLNEVIGVSKEKLDNIITILKA